MPYTGKHATTTTSYDDLGRVQSVTDADSRTITYEYDPLGRQTKTIYASGVETENSYTCCNLQWSDDEENRRTQYAYDDMNRVTDVWNPGISGQSLSTPLVHYEYDAFGNIATVTTRSDANTTRITTYTYDKLNRVTKIVYPYNSTEEDMIGNEEFIYDVAGRLALKKDGNDKVTAYEYDTLGRLRGVDYEYAGSFALPIQGFSADVTCGYEEYDWNTLSFDDAGGSLKTSMTDSTGTSRYYYDPQGRLSRYVPSVRNPGDDSYPYVVSYEYNNLGQKTTMKIGAVSGQCSAADPFKYATCELTNVVYDAEYAYYANGWLKSVKSGASDVADYTYDVVGNRTQVMTSPHSLVQL